MKQKINASLRRVLCMLLSIAMLLSFVVMPAGAETTADSQSVGSGAAATAAGTATQIFIEDINHYDSEGTNDPIIIYGDWLKTVAESRSTIKTFYDDHVHFVDLMPVSGLGDPEKSGDTAVIDVVYNADDTVTLTNVDTTKSYSYVTMNYGITVDLVANPYIYATWTGNAKFNMIIQYWDDSGNDYSERLSFIAGQGNDDYAAGGGTVLVNFAEYLQSNSRYPADGNLTIGSCQYYVSEDNGNASITLNDIRFVSDDDSDGVPDADSESRTGAFMDGYTAIIVEYMGKAVADEDKTTLDVSDSEFFVDAVLDCSKDFDENPHELMAKTQYGFVLYMPTSSYNALTRKPARGDLVAGAFPYSKISTHAGTYNDSNWENFNHNLFFYQNYADDLSYADAANVNATVKLFNYDYSSAINSGNGYNFWNGHWGWGGNIESVDGAGVEGGTHEFPVMLDTLDADGYPQLSNGSTSLSLGYLFNGTTNRADGSSTLIDTMTNGGGLFQQDANGYYYYDSMQNAAYYDPDANDGEGGFVLYEDLIVRPWYHAFNGDDYGNNYPDFAPAAGAATAYGNFLPFNKVTTDNITVDGAVYNEDHSVDSANNAAGSLEAFGMTATAADKVLPGTKAMNTDAYNTIVASNGGDVTTARLENKVDMGFGMTVDFDFYMPQSGLVNGEAMKFDFLGDDDVFVYVGIWNGTEYDYRLVLDIGGTHNAKSGNIDFSTGTVTDWPAGNTAARTGRTLKEIFGEGYEKYFDGNTFADFSKLSLKFFYLERGGNISYCRLRFNMPTLPENSLTIGKALDQDVLGSQTYKFRVLKAELNAETGEYEVTDTPFFTVKDTDDEIKYTITGTNKVGVLDEDGYFTLTPGQSVTFTDVLTKSESATHYVVEEIISNDVDGQFTYESPVCAVNGVNVTVQEITDGSESPSTHTYRTDVIELNTTQTAARAANMEVVGFTNIVAETLLGTLRITKQIKENAEIDPDDSFDMRVTIGGKLLPVGTTYDVVDAANHATIISDNVVVTKAGIVTLKAGQTVVIERILSTSTFEVTEVSYNAAPTYSSVDSCVTCTGSNAYGTMPLGEEDAETGEIVGAIIDILVVNDDSSGLIVDKTVKEGTTDEDFVLTLEAFATGTETTITSTTPADIVLVLDQSASMYTPEGMQADNFWAHWIRDGENGQPPESAKVTDFVTKALANDAELLRTAAHCGYYIAMHDTLKLMYIVQYVDGGWYYVPVKNTTTPVAVDTETTYNDSFFCLFEDTNGDGNHGTDTDGDGIYSEADGDKFRAVPLTYAQVDLSVLTGCTYYRTQYAALYDSVSDFVDKLADTGVNHRLAIVGFSSPYYDGIADYSGSGVYIGETFYLFDEDYKYKGFMDSDGNYLLYATGDLYDEMKDVLPAAQKNITWTDTLPSGITTDDLLLLDVTNAFSGNYFEATSAIDMTLSEYEAQVVSGTVYKNALVSVIGSADSNNDSNNDGVNDVINQSIEAITTNFLQTCPAAGLVMAQNIFAENTTTNRDKIVILFTDGVPTVSLEANRERGASKDARVKEQYWSGISGVKDAVNAANQLKTDDVQIYTIGTSALSAEATVNTSLANDGAEVVSVTGEKFLAYVSSNYKDIESTHTITTETGNDQVLTASKLSFTQNDVVITDENAATTAATTYAKTAEDGSISVAFEEIMQSVSTPSVTLDEKAVLREVLTDYFDLADGENLDEVIDKNDIKTYIASYAGVVNGVHTFNDRTEATDLTVNLVASGTDGRIDTIEVSGFDYSSNYVNQNAETNECSGYKLIVEVPIKAREGFWGGNNVPTNKDTTAIYDDGKLIEEFPVPEVNVPIGVGIGAVDRTIYYGNETDSDVLFDKLTIDVCGTETDQTVKYVNGTPMLETVVDGETVLTEIPEWMTKYVEIELSKPDSINTTTPGDYTYSVTLKPTSDGTMNESPNPSNMAGTPVGNTSAEDDGHIYVLVPQYTFKDTTVQIGATNDFANNLASDLSWVNVVAGETIPTEATILGTAPTLNLTYKAGESAITDSTKIYEDTSVEVTVSSSNDNTEQGIVTQNVVIFKWADCQLDEHSSTDHGTIEAHKGNAASNEFWIHIGGILPDTVVIDFGLSVDIHVLNNDEIVDPVLYSINATGCQFGTAAMNDNGTVRYSINTMSMNSHDTFTYTVYSGTEGTGAENFVPAYTYSSTVMVIPATTIYYEDNFGSIIYDSFEFTPGAEDAVDSTVEWSDASVLTGVQDQDRPGESVLDGIDADSIYGYDSHYTGMQTHSMNSARMFTASEDENGKITYGTATFTFTGTGFDVISLTSGKTGTITVEVMHEEGEENWVTDKALVVDTFYGYTYDESTGEWNEYAGEEAVDPDTLYQVPVIKVSGLTYGTYKAIITISYNDFFNHYQYGTDEAGEAVKKYDFYLDAIRIYDPANDGEGNDVIENAYIDDDEGWPEYFELRNLIIKRDDLDYSSDGGSTVASGVVFIDNVGTADELDVADYKNYGPNNELYLAPGQSIAFYLDAPDGHAAIHMAMKSVGNTAKVQLYTLENGALVEYALKVNGVEVSEIGTATDLYYDISDLDGKTLVIRNAGEATDAILSITNVKITYLSAHTDSIEQTYFTVTPSAVKDVLTSLNKTEDDSISSTENTVTMTSASLSLEDEVLLNFYFTVSDDTAVTLNTAGTIAENLGLLIWNEQPAADNATYGTADSIVDGALYDADQSRYMSYTPGIAAKNLGDDLYVRAYIHNTDGSYTYSDIVTYSPKTYAYNRLADDTSNMHALCVALLNYGAAAQTYFGYKTDALVNANLTDGQQALVSAYNENMFTGAVAAEETKVDSFAATDGFDKKTASVSFDGAFAINYYFTPSETVEGNVTFYYWTADAYKDATTLSADNATGTVTMLNTGTGRYWAEITGIAAKQIDDTFYAAAVYSVGTNTYCTGVIPYSVSKYCISKAGGTDDLAVLAQATAMYGFYAKQYFTTTAEG